MNELKRKVIEVMNQINQDWKEAINEAEETEQGVDFSVLFSKYSQNLVDLDHAFVEFKERVNKNKKWFK